MNQQQTRHDLNGGDHYWSDTQPPAVPRARWHEPANGLAWMLVPVFMLLLFGLWTSLRPAKPLPLTPTPTATPAMLSQVPTAPARYAEAQTNYAQGRFFYYSLANENGTATLDTDQAKVIFRGVSYGDRCTHDSRTMSIWDMRTIEPARAGNPAPRTISVDNGIVTVIFSGHCLTFSNRLSQLQIDKQVFDVSRTKPTLEINPDGTITQYVELAVPLPSPHQDSLGTIYVDSSCR